MDFLLLPEKIKKSLSVDGIEQASVLTVLRSGGSLDGAAGEGYLVSCRDRLALFSRHIGEDAYRNSTISYQDSSLQMALRKDKFHSVLDIIHGGETSSLRFSSYEENSVKPVLAAWESCRTGAPTAATQAPSPQPTIQKTRDFSLSPMAGGAAALMYLTTIDGSIGEAEDAFIRRFCLSDDAALKTGHAFYKNHSFDELLQALSGLDQQQALCILANMMELAMLDGLFRSSEQNMLRRFAEAMRLTADEYATVRDVLLVKNQLSVLQPAGS